MHQGCQLLVWPSLTPRGSVWKGIFGWNDYIISNVVKFDKHDFRGILHWKFLRRAYRLPTNLISWSMQRWRHLNWWISDEFNWWTLTRVPKMKDHRIPLTSIDGPNSGETSQCAKSRTKFPARVMMLEKWLSYLKVTIYRHG